jgi:hypothetical protein
VCGHLESDNDGGAADFYNIMPICKSCNSKFKEMPTPDERPDGWVERFIELIRAGQPAQANSKQVNLLSSSQNNENSDVRNVLGSNETLKTHYITCPNLPAQIVQQIFEESADWGANDGVPSPKTMSMPRRAELEQRVRDSSPEDFRIAAAQFRRDKPWLTGDDRHPYASNDSWAELAMSHSFKRLVKRGREFETRVAAENEKAYAKLRENDWAQYLRVADVPIWEGIPGDDKALVEAAIADKNSAVRSIDDKTMRQCREIPERYDAYVGRLIYKFRGELYTPYNRDGHKDSRLAKLHHRAATLKVNRFEWNVRFAELRDRIADTKSMKVLQDCAAVIDGMNAELDRLEALNLAAQSAVTAEVPKRKARRRR